MAEGMFIRVYHEDLIANFGAVWDDDRLLSAWLRLFAIADKLWPSPAELPRSVRKAALATLVEVGLILPLPKNRYQVRGLDADRMKRRQAAIDAAAVRWSNAEGNAVRNAGGGASASPKAMPRTHRSARPQSVSAYDVVSSTGVRGVGEGDETKPDPWPLVRLVEQLSGRSWGYGAHTKSFATFAADIEALGAAKVEEAIRAAKAEANGSAVTPEQLVYAAHKTLFPLFDAPRATAAERKQAADAEILTSLKERADRNLAAKKAGTA